MADVSLVQHSQPNQGHPHPRGRSLAPGTLKSLLYNRWVGLAAASWVESCSGVAYMFSLYSQSFRDSLGYTQTMVDLVGMAKDIGGNVGITSGFLGDLAPPWVVLAVGATQNSLGYFALWLALTGRVQGVPFWAVMVVTCIGCNGATFFNTAGLVTCVKNFPSSRGPVVGLLKGYIGLSGALFTQLYLALYAPDHDSFILMAAWMPSLIAIVAMPAIHNLPPSILDPRERPQLSSILACSICAALFLLGITLLDHYVHIGRVTSFVVALIVFAALAFPALFAWNEVNETRGPSLQGPITVRESEEEGGTEERKLLLAGDTQDSSAGLVTAQLRSSSGSKQSSKSVRQRQRSPPQGETDEETSDTDAPPRFLVEAPPLRYHPPKPLSPRNTIDNPVSPSNTLTTFPPQVNQFPRVGEDHSLIQAAMTVNFWLIYVAMTGASGSGLTAINNLGQFGRSMGYGQSEIGVFVSLMSIWNFLGRVGAGYISEYFFYERGWPRPFFMVLTQLTMAVGHIVFASAGPGSLYVGSVIVGLCYGAQWGLMPAVASEVFGLKYFGTLYNWLTITNPTGSYLLSVCVAGYLYDYEAEQEASAPIAPGEPPSPPGALQSCHGAHCFRLTFLIMAASCVVAGVLSGLLTLLTRQYYSDEYAKRKALVVSRVESAELESGH